MTQSSNQSSFPTEIRNKIQTFDAKLHEIELIFNRLHQTPMNEIVEEMSSLEAAKVELVSVYTLNSLFWMYLITCGVNPKEHHIRQELDRIQKYMSRLKEIQDKEKAMKLDKNASKRMVKNALWDPSKKNEQNTKTAESNSDQNSEPAFAEKKQDTSTVKSENKSSKKRSLWEQAHNAKRQSLETKR